MQSSVSSCGRNKKSSLITLTFKMEMEIRSIQYVKLRKDK